MTPPPEQSLPPHAGPAPTPPETAAPASGPAPRPPGQPRVGPQARAAAFDEAEVRALLGGDDDAVGQAVVLIDRFLRRRLCRWLHRRCPGLSPDDLDDAWSALL